MDVRGRGRLLIVVALLTVIAGMAAAEHAHAAGTVTVDVNGRGDVSGEGIDCSESGGPDCTQTYSDEATGEEECDGGIPPICFPTFESPTKDFTADADRGGYTFQNWSGCDSVDNRVCTLTVEGDTTITATFQDAQAPSVSNLTPAQGTVISSGFTAAAAASDNAGIQRVDFKLGGVLFASDTSAPYQGLNSLGPNPIQGTRTLSATAHDVNGLQGSANVTVTIDTVAPELTIDTGPSEGEVLGAGDDPSWTFTADDATSGVDAVECSVVPAGAAPVWGSCSGDPTSHSATGPLADGNYTFHVRATDEGDLQTTRSRSFSVDATAPETAIDSGPANGSAQRSGDVSFGFSSSEPGSAFECRLHASGVTPPAFGPCSAPASHSASDLGPGTYVFSVRATDGAGNADQAPASRTFSIDRAAPATTILKGPKPVVRTKKKKSRAKFEFESSEGGSSFECSLDGAGFGACSSPWKLKVKKGKHILRVRATDQAGNTESDPAEHAWKVKRKR